VLGVTLAAHGAQKLFGWFGGPGLSGTGAVMETLGFLPGRRHAFLAGLTEAAGGALLALGFVTPLAASIVFSVMLVAGITVHVKQGFFLQNGGYEYTVVLGLSALSVAFTGPGSLSVDALLGWNLSGAAWGAAALLVGLAGAASQLAGRRQTAALHAEAA
jgi:putative oxidoreductase